MLADFVQVLQQKDKLVVQLACGVGYFLRISALFLCTPKRLNRPQHRHQSGMADHHHPLRKGIVKNIWRFLQG